MKYEELINDLCEVIKESEVNASKLYEYLEDIENIVNSYDIIEHDKSKIKNKVSDALGLLQHQDLHRQKIERVVNFVCEKNGIDKSQYNIANSAKSLDSKDNIDEDELEALIKQMQS